MGKGDRVLSYNGKWKGVILKKTLWGYLVRWETGPLAGREANVLRAYLKREK